MPTRSLAPHLDDRGDATSLARSPLEREYELVRRLDVSHSGESWLAVRKDDGQEVVVSTFVAIPSTGQESSVLNAVLKRERLLLSRLPPHPHLAPVDLGLEDGLPFLATPQIEGDDLPTLVAQTGPLALDDAAECLRQALLGLHHAHEHGVAHGDLRPADLVLDDDGILKIRRLGWGAVALGRDASSSIADDLRNLARVLHLLLTGDSAAPVCEECESNGNGRPVSLRVLRPGAPEAMVDFHTRLAIAPAGFASAAEALWALEDAWRAIEDAAADEMAAWLQCDDPVAPQVTCGVESAVEPGVEPGVEPSVEPSAASSVEAPVALDQKDEASGDTPRPRDRRLWLMGSAAAVLATILAAAAYILSQ